MKIMLVEPNFPGMYGYEVVFPFGYACLGAVLQHAGHEVEYIFPAANRLSIHNVINHISNTDANLIGIGALLPYLPTVSELVSEMKAIRPDIPIVVGGQMVTHTPELALRKTGADFCVAGEGEIALLKLVNCIRGNKDYSDIPGLVFQRDGQVINNGRAETILLEDIPMPNWDDFPMDYYMYAGSRPPPWSDTKPKRVFTWMLSRGCPMKCNFCVSGCEPRHKTIAQSITELREIVDRFDPDYITFVDNLLTPNKTYTTELCEAFLTNGFRFKFSAAGHAKLVDPQLLTLMKRAGCQAIFYGLECANNDILSFIKKGITVERMLQVIKMTKEAGIYPMVSIMFGQPGETFDDFFRSLQVVLTAIDPEDPVPNIASVMPLLTFPGTEMYNYAKEHGYFADDEDYWHKYGGKYQIQYNHHTNETAGQLVDIAKAMSCWAYHQSMTDNLLESLRHQRSSHYGCGSASPRTDQDDLCRFLDRCVNELVVSARPDWRQK